MSRTLENVRRLVEWNRQRSLEHSPSNDVLRIGRVGKLGAGRMGTAIAAAHVLHQLPVVLCDFDEEVFAGACRCRGGTWPSG